MATVRTDLRCNAIREAPFPVSLVAHVDEPSNRMSVRRRFTVALLADVETAPDADQMARLRASLKGPVAYDELSARLAASTIVQAREEFAAARRVAKRLTNVIPTARIVDEVSVQAPRGWTARRMTSP